jgi:hypothetical protein
LEEEHDEVSADKSDIFKTMYLDIYNGL